MRQAAENMHTVLIADDHDLIVDMVENVLAAENRFLTNRASSYEGVISEIGEHGAYDLVLLDLDMPGMNGLRGVESIIEKNAGGAVVLFSGQARQEAVFRALELGARGYIPKTLSVKSLKNAIQFVLAGENFMPSSVATSMATSKIPSKDALLSSKEMDVLRGICRGDRNKDIARALNLSEISIKLHVRSICTKLGVTNRTQVAVTAIARGLS